MDALFRPLPRHSRRPAHALVRDRLLACIQEGALKEGDRLPPEPDIAARLGVSRMTANRAILSLVSDGWLHREKGKGTFVAKAAGTPALRVAIGIPEDPVAALDDHYFGALYWKLRAEFARRSIGVEAIPLRGGLAKAAQLAGGLGLVAVSPSKAVLPELRRIADSGAPVVLLGSFWDDDALGAVDSDNILGATLAANHLADLGHRNILFLGACPGDSNTRDRVRGFQTALKARGIDPGVPIMMPAVEPFSPETVQALTARLTGEDRPTAVFAAGASLAVQLLGLAHNLGLSVPESLSVVGYDDPAFLSMAYPPITTVRQPLAEMAAAACDMVAGRLGGGEPAADRRMLDPELILRSTTAVPRPDFIPGGKSYA